MSEYKCYNCGSSNTKEMLKDSFRCFDCGTQGKEEEDKP